MKISWQLIPCIYDGSKDYGRASGRLWGQRFLAKDVWVSLAGISQV